METRGREEENEETKRARGIQVRGKVKLPE